MKRDNDIEYRVSYAQNREDIILSGFLANVTHGFYVDIGANHPSIYSVTKLFYDQGWNGINVEPMRSFYTLLQQARPRDINLNIGIANQEGSLNFREYPDGDGLSTFSLDIKSEYEKENKNITRNHVDYSVSVSQLKTIFKENDVQDIHFMKVDVEGFEFEVLKSNDWKIYRPWVICIESAHIIHPWRDYLEEKGYIYAFSDGLNQYYVAEEKKELYSNFSYAETILSRPIVSQDIQKILDLEIGARKVAESKLKQNELDMQFLRSEVSRLHHVIAQSQRLKGSVKQLLRAFDRAILVYIEKMNTPRTSSGVQHPPLEATDPETLLKTMRQYDFEVYYSQRSGEKMGYRAILRTYLFLTRTPVRAIRKIRLQMRKEG